MAWSFSGITNKRKEGGVAKARLNFVDGGRIAHLDVAVDFPAPDLASIIAWARRRIRDHIAYLATIASVSSLGDQFVADGTSPTPAAPDPAPDTRTQAQRDFVAAREEVRVLAWLERDGVVLPASLASRLATKRTAVAAALTSDPTLATLA